MVIKRIKNRIKLRFCTPKMQAKSVDLEPVWGLKKRRLVLKMTCLAAKTARTSPAGEEIFY